MSSYGISPERIFNEKLSGKDTKRPKLQELMSTVKAGDKVIVESISRFARSTKDLLELVDKLTEKGVEFVSLKERIDTTTATGKFVLAIFGAVAEMERSCMLERQAAGIAAAQVRGVKFGRPEIVLPDNFVKLVRDWECGELRLCDVLAKTELKEATFFRRLREYRSLNKYTAKVR